MTRESWIYPADGSPPYRKGERPEQSRPDGVTILPDLPDFVSPIDGKQYSGRAGMREHCAKHDVVPTADLKGLPWLTSQSDQRSPEQKRADTEHRKRLVINEVDKQYRRYNG
jgi:hypothetical protein